MAWTENGPVSLPPRPVAYFAATLVFALAIVGVGLGFRASWRNGDRPSVGGDQALGVDAATPAQPIVEIPALQQQAAAANAVASNSAGDKDEADDSNDIAAKTAAAQDVQSNPTKADQSIDDVLTSGSEKPQAPAKPSTDEDAPGTPKGKASDVPF
jgi:hypothetical protein